MPDASDVVVVEALRSPIGKRGGVLSGLHPAVLLGEVQRSTIERAGIDPEQVGQIVGGCVDQVGEQTQNVARTAWLTAGLPLTVAASTVDAQCGSSQQATALAAALVGSRVVDVAMSCGVEVMSRVPMGATLAGDYGDPIPSLYEERYESTTQFEGAERIAERWGITRADCDELGLRSQRLAHQAYAQNRFASQLVPIEAPLPGENGAAGGEVNGRSQLVDRDQGLRETTREALGGLRPVQPDGVHTAGSSSQISDGASAVLLARAETASALGLSARARIVDSCLIGSDPELMLTGPIDATRTILERNGLALRDIDVIEINEAFASVVLAWQRELDADMERVNPNGGAIALGHPLGATGAGLVTKAVHELERGDGRLALVTMCCGGGLGTGMLLERV
ncbi:MAG: acetyl-CoA acetyltransferase [Solirubrobacterales bacterium]|nr:acetyl-CoA acetyltransferase [Solirubrobacterales bacterium]